MGFSSLPEIGAVLGGKYSITRQIGEGGMGVVYEAFHTRLRQRVAVKMLLPELASRGDIVARFEREARAAAELRSRHVARVLDVDALADGTPYMVMEFLEGRDLSAQLQARGPLPIAEAVDYLLQACEAMAEAHRLGTVHRDLKPSNLFLSEDGGRRSVKVLDFGISKVANDGSNVSVTSSFMAMGTALYMSPEQVRSAKHVDARSDVWALGIVLYELLAGRTPFVGETAPAVAAAIVADPAEPIQNLRADVSPELASVLMTALEKDRNLRFKDASALAGALAAVRAVASAPVAEHATELALSTSSTSDGMRDASSGGATTDGAWSGRSATSNFPASRLYVGLAVGGVALLASVVAYRALTPTQQPELSLVSSSAPAASAVASPVASQPIGADAPTSIPPSAPTPAAASVPTATPSAAKAGAVSAAHAAPKVTAAASPKAAAAVVPKAAASAAFATPASPPRRRLGGALPDDPG